MSYFAPLRQTTPSLASKTHHRSLRWIISVAQKLTVCWQRLGKKGARPCGLLWVLLVWAKEGKVYFICPVAATKGGLGWGWCWCWFWGGVICQPMVQDVAVHVLLETLANVVLRSSWKLKQMGEPSSWARAVKCRGDEIFLIPIFHIHPTAEGLKSDWPSTA